MKILKFIFMGFFCFIFITNKLNADDQKMIVCKPVVDLRLKPENPDYKKNMRNINYPIFCNDCYGSFLHENNPLQDSQLLLGDKVILKENLNNGWLEVCAIEQKEFKNRNWNGKIGFIKSDEVCNVDEFYSNNLVVKKQWANIYESFSNENEDNPILMKVSIGTKLFGKAVEPDSYIVFLSNGKVGIIRSKDVYLVDDNVEESVEKIRMNLCENAKLFLESPYSWGGRSGWDSENIKQQTGVDCSSLMNLIYASLGFEIPRDASDQYFFCSKISGKEMEEGDLIFFENKKRKGRMWHVLIYLGGGKILESRGHAPFKCIEVSDVERLGRPIKEIISGEECNGETVFFGSLLNNDSIIKKMRKFFISKE